MDYYKILEVDKSIDPEGLKKAYKKKAMKHHPDKGGDEATFKQINEAYQVLSDPEKKTMYDNYGTADPQEFHQRRYNNGGAENIFGGMRFHRTNDGDLNFDDILRNFSTFGAGFRQHQRMRPQNRDVRVRIDITLKDSILGKVDEVTFKLPSGQIEIIQVNIPAGVTSGDKIKYAGKGETTVPDAPPGDMYVVINVMEQAEYQIQGRDIHTRLFVDIFDFILGSKQLITTPDGTSINISIPQGTNPGTTLSVNEHGIPGLHGERRGKLFVELRCKIPSYNNKELEQIRKLKEKLKKD